MSTLGSQGIVDAIEKGIIRIDPFDEDLLQPNSYDVRIGRDFYLPSKNKELKILNLSYKNNNIIQGIWSGPFVSIDYKDNSYNVVIPPKTTILAHTIEYIGAYTRYRAQLRSKSTIARCMIEVCASAGFGDVGYVNRWTLEIDNKSDLQWIIPVGTRIAQLEFTEVVGEGKVYDGSYKQQPVWDPDQMLPVIKPSIYKPIEDKKIIGGFGE